MGVINENLREKAMEYREQSELTVAAFAELIGVERSAVSTYLNENAERLSQGRIDEIESSVQRLVEASTTTPKRRGALRTRDLEGVTFVCQSCQETSQLGIIYGRAGLGKTYGLKNFAKLPKVIYIECNEAMTAKDLMTEIEEASYLPKGSGTLHERMKVVKEFFEINNGYLLLFDEVDKLMTRYTQKKIEILRNLSDAGHVGMVLAGEPALYSIIKRSVPRLIDRIIFCHKMVGVSTEEAGLYLDGYMIDDRAKMSIIRYGTNDKDGSFRRLARTFDNVLRVAGDSRITADTVEEARGFML